MACDIDESSIRYVLDGDKVEFIAETGSKDVRCSVTSEALQSLTERPSTGTDLEAVLIKYADVIGRAAERKLQADANEPDGSVAIALRDLSSTRAGTAVAGNVEGVGRSPPSAV